MTGGTNIGVLGTGIVGQTIAAKLAGLGHAVMVGTRDPGATLARTSPEGSSKPSFATWLEAQPGVQLGTLAQAAAHGEVVINATNGVGAISALEGAGEENLAGKVLIDISNPLDFSNGFPPSLAVSNTDSLGEQIQRRFPDARVVKTLNTTNCEMMVNPGQLAAADHTIFVSGNDPAAKQTASALLQSFGWQDIIDLGDITTARGTEMLLPIWVRLLSKLGTARFQFKIVR